MFISRILKKFAKYDIKKEYTKNNKFSFKTQNKQNPLCKYIIEYNID